MSFKLFLLCSFFLIGRPQDILTFLQPLRPALALIVLAMVALILGDRRKEISATFSMPETRRYLAFFVIMVIGIPFSYHRGTAFDAVVLKYVPSVLFFILLVSEVTTLQRLKTLVWVVCLSTLTYSVFGGVLQIGDVSGGRFRVLGGTFDPNDTAYILVSLFPLCLYFVRFNEGLFKRVVAVVTACSAVAIVLQTGSRGGILGLGMVLLILLFTNIGGIQGGIKILFIALVAMTAVLVSDRIDLERFLTLSDASSDYNVWAEGGRFTLWRAAIELALSNPLTGVGVECYPFANFYSRELVGESYLRWQAVHNSYLQIAAEVGLIGFAVFMVIIMRSLLTFFRMSRIEPRSREASEISGMAGLMFVGFAGLLTTGFFLSQGYSIFATLYFALAAAVARIHAGASDNTASHAASRSPRHERNEAPRLPHRA